MMTKRVFEFSKLEEIEIGGETFTIDSSEEKALEHQKAYEEAKKSMEKVQSLDVNTATSEEIVDAFQKSKEYAKNFLDSQLGDGAFDKLYEKSGQRLSEMVGLMAYLNEIQTEKMEDIKKKQKTKYVKKGQK